MSDVFNYKPDLQYHLDDVNTIDNIQIGDSYANPGFVRNRGSIAIEDIDACLLRVANTKSVIDKRLKDVNIPINSRAIDDLVRAYARGHNDGEKLIRENLITYDFYKYSLDKTPLSQVVYAWEMHQFGIDGMIEGEFLPQLNFMESNLICVKDAVNKIVNYDMKSTSIEDLKVEELLDIENYIQLDRHLDVLYNTEDVDTEEVITARKRLESKHSRLRLKNAVSKTAIKFALGMSESIDAIEESLTDNTVLNKQTIYGGQADQLKAKLSKTELTLPKIKMIIYQGFKSKNDKLVAKKQDIDNATANQESTYRDIITKARLYLDVAMPTLNELEYIPINEPEAIGFHHLIEGIEDLVVSKQSAILEIMNTTKAAVQLNQGQLESIIDKDQSRTMYKGL